VAEDRLRFLTSPHVPLSNTSVRPSAPPYARTPPCKVHRIFTVWSSHGGVDMQCIICLPCGADLTGRGGCPTKLHAPLPHTSDVRRVIRSAGNLCKIHRLLVRYST
jgi:hypothetical protein